MRRDVSAADDEEHRMRSVTDHRRPPERPPKPRTATPGVAVQATGVVKVYGRGPAAVRALDGVTVSFGAGQLNFRVEWRQ